MLIVGQQEMDGNSVSVRRHGEGDQGSETLEAFLALLGAEVSAAFNREKAS
jgi:threonyl-tRNA synthetase